MQDYGSVIHSWLFACDIHKPTGQLCGVYTILFLPLMI